MDSAWGNCIIEHLKDYTVIDLETTGLSAQWDAIIEVAAIRVRDHQVVDTFTELVNPERELDEFITELTGITNEMVADARTIDAVLHDFLSFIGSDVIVGHNIRFDLRFLEHSADQTGALLAGNDFIDTMLVSRRLYPELYHHRLRDMAQLFELAKAVDHRAGSDTALTQKLYELLCDELEDRPDREYLRQKRLASKPAKGLVREDGCVIDENAIYFGRQFVFTGTLERMNRRDAMQIVVNHGGNCADSVTKETNYLVLGNNDYIASIKDGKSNKQKKAEAMKLKGKDIEIISEDVFYALFDITSEEESKVKVQELADQQHARAAAAEEKARQIEEERRAKQEEKERIRQEKELAKQKAAAEPKKPAGRAILQLTDDMTVIRRYESIAEAVRESGVNSKSIRDAANGVQKRAGGFVWRYEDAMDQ